MTQNFTRASDDDDSMPFWLLPKKTQQAKGAEAVEARYTSRNNICPVHHMAFRLIDGKCDDCE